MNSIERRGDFPLGDAHGGGTWSTVSPARGPTFPGQVSAEVDPCPRRIKELRPIWSPVPFLR